MKSSSRLIVLLVFVVAALMTLATSAMASSLVYSDEFSGPLATATWTNDTPWNTHYTTGELEYYDPANVTFANGMMTLKSENRATHGYSYASGIVTSLPHTKFTYGYFEIRAKLPKGPGIWPAFWLTNDSTLEIDALEMLGDKPGRIYQTLHENNSQIYQGINNGPDYSAGFHTFGVDWQPTYVKWYIDGVLTASYVHAMPSDPMWICLNTAVGGAWPGSPTAATSFPVNYDIDYVRVYDTKPAPVVAPVAAADTYSVANGTTLNVAAPGLLANDHASGSAALSAAMLAQPAHGMVNVAADGSCTYVPDAGFSGTDSFTYRAFDGTSYSVATSVSIKVAAPVVLTPVALPDTYSTPSNTTLIVPAAGLLANDTSALNLALSAAVVAQPAHGTLTMASDGSFVYVPDAGYSGADVFSYLASDGQAVSGATKCVVNVAPATSTPPTAVPAPVPTTTTTVTKPVVHLKNRNRRTYRVSGTVRVTSSSRVVLAMSSIASVRPVLARVQVQRRVSGHWRAFSMKSVVSQFAAYSKVITLRKGVFRVRTLVASPNVKSAWSKTFRVR